jgi:hypothetical protein
MIPKRPFRKPGRSIHERFMDFVVVDQSGCWLWSGGIKGGKCGWEK